MSSDPVIDVRGVAKSFKLWSSPAHRIAGALGIARPRLRPALLDVSFSAVAGECIGIVGVNGAGKSTLLQILAGSMAPSAGSVAVRGRVGAILELGAGFHPEFSGRENARLGLTILGVPRSGMDAAIREVEAFAEIGAYIDAPVRTYSSGMYVRLAFAVAAFGAPQLLIVDEALAVGDVPFQQRCYAYMTGTLRDSTKIIVSHDLVALSAICERIVVLSGGKVVHDGAPDSAIRAYNRIVHASRAVSLAGQSGTGDGAAPDAVGSDGLVPVPADGKSGIGEADVEAAAVEVDGHAASAAMPGDLVTVSARLRNRRDSPMHAVLAVALADRRGHETCGQDTLPLLGAPLELPPGASVARISFRWPRLAPGGYLVSLAVEEVDPASPKVRDVQCRANHFAEVSSTAVESVRGMFNFDIDEASVAPA